jgi:hypothetical protein
MRKKTKFPDDDLREYAALTPSYMRKKTKSPKAS